MIHFLALRDRIFEVERASVLFTKGLWSVEIDTVAQVFDGEAWAPRLSHQGLRLPACTVPALAGVATSWAQNMDAAYVHPEPGLMYVFGHHDVYAARLAFGRLESGCIEVAWQGLCDVYWDADFHEAVPFRCQCVAGVRMA